MTSNGFKIKCFTCDNEFTFGPNIYDGKHINIYDIDICNNCYISNHDGWSPLHEEKILNHIKRPLHDPLLIVPY